jgi:hypothetical protein
VNDRADMSGINASGKQIASLHSVMPVKTGIHLHRKHLDTGLRRYDGEFDFELLGACRRNTGEWS